MQLLPLDWQKYLLPRKSDTHARCNILFSEVTILGGHANQIHMRDATWIPMKTTISTTHANQIHMRDATWEKSSRIMPAPPTQIRYTCEMQLSHLNTASIKQSRSISLPCMNFAISLPSLASSPIWRCRVCMIPRPHLLKFVSFLPSLGDVALPSDDR